MAWENIAQITYMNIPQLMVPDPPSFITAYNQNATNAVASLTSVWNGSAGTNITNGTLLGSGGNRVEFQEASGNYYVCYPYYNGTRFGNGAGSGFKSERSVAFIALVDESQQKGLFLLLYRFNSGGNVGTGTAYGISQLGSQFYVILTANPLIIYNWESVGSISGKLGVFNLGTINNADIGDGSAVSGANYSVINSLAESARTKTILRNMANGETKDLMYSGDVFKCTITAAATTATLRFYVAPGTGGTPNEIYNYTFQRYNLEVLSGSGQFIGFIIDEEKRKACLNMIHVLVNQQTGVKTVDYCYPGTTMTDTQMSNMYAWIKGSYREDGPLDSFVDNAGDGGGTLINRTDNPIPKPGLPSKTAFNTGFISQFMIDDQALNDLASKLWSSDFIDAIKRFFNDPMEILIGLKIFPKHPEHLGSSREIRGGGVGTGVQGTPLTSQWSEYDMGSCVVEKRLQKDDGSEDGGIYFDYAPYTQINIYLPFCGEHSLDPDDVMGKTLHLYYKVDHLSGGCVANLVIENPDDPNAPKTCHYNFSGQMGVDCPISQADYRAKASAIISTGIVAGTAIATVATGGLTAPLTGAAAKAAGVESGTQVTDKSSVIGLASRSSSRLANNVANMHPTVQHTSGGGEVTGCLSSEYPYITISEPDIFDADNQKHYKGYPINGTYNIGDFSGYVEIEAVHLDGLSCTENERNAIRQALLAGVIINKTNPSSTPSYTGDIGLVLLKNTSDPDTIGKHWSSSTEVQGRLFYDVDIETPKVQVEGNYTDYNYCYIGVLHRFYYIKSFHIDTGVLMTLELDCDPLQSFKDEIEDIPALVDSAEDLDKAHLLVNNGYWYMKQKKNIKTITFKKEGSTQFFDRSSTGTECYLLTIAGDCTPTVTPV